jgi:hypothetical protein
MKRNIIKFVVAIVLVAITIVVGNQVNNSEMQTAGGGLSLKQANDTTKVNVVAFAQADANTDGEYLGQITVITNWEHPYGNGLFVGADLIGTASTQFGVMAPTIDVRGGLNLKAFRLECKVGNFTRSSVTTAGFGPQFANNCILWGESASVSNAVQLAILAKSTKLYVGHQGGEKFYQFNDGNYYAGAEQRIGNIALSGGVNFTEQTTGFAAAKWSFKNNVLTATANKLGSENQNFVFSYLRDRISLGKGFNLSLGSAVYLQPTKKGLHLIAGLNKGRFTLFTQTGGYKQTGIFTPMGGLGLNYTL